MVKAVNVWGEIKIICNFNLFNLKLVHVLWLHKDSLLNQLTCFPFQLDRPVSHSCREFSQDLDALLLSLPQAVLAGYRQHFLFSGYYLSAQILSVLYFLAPYFAGLPNFDIASPPREGMSVAIQERYSRLAIAIIKNISGFTIVELKTYYSLSKLKTLMISYHFYFKMMNLIHSWKVKISITSTYFLTYLFSLSHIKNTLQYL